MGVFALIKEVNSFRKIKNICVLEDKSLVLHIFAE
jgi:hypothetical protein